MMLMVAIGLLFSTSSVRAQADYKVINVLTAQVGTVKQYVDGDWKTIVNQEPCAVQFKFCSDKVVRTTDDKKTSYKVTADNGEGNYGIISWDAISSGGEEVVISVKDAGTSDAGDIIFLGIFYKKTKVLLTFITTSLKVTHSDPAVRKI